MSGLHAERFVLLGGPLAGTADTLLIVSARDRAEIEARLAGDPWATHDLLRVAQVLPWNLRLGALG